MKNILIVPDSFKGTLSSTEVCNIIKETLKEKYPSYNILTIPVADGGEGTCEAYLHIFGGEKVFLEAKSPLGKDIDVWYARLPDGTAVIETAMASGLNSETEKDALAASTYGTGQIILHALKSGAKKIILGLGGSATTDGGTGMLRALGVKFLDADGKELPAGAKYLNSLFRIDADGIEKRLTGTQLTVLCDVKNPLYGKNGAAFVYAKQKGASESDIVFLDKGLKRLAEVCESFFRKDYSSVQGAGAAGGMGFACVSFLSGNLKSGIDTVLDEADFDTLKENADIIITGEGKMDSQSLMGKVPFGVAKRAKGKKVVAVVGVLDAPMDKVKEKGISEVYETNSSHLPFEKIKMKAKQQLVQTIKYIKL